MNREAMTSQTPSPDPSKTVPLGGPVEQPSVREAERAIQQAAKEGTNLDTLIGRLVVDTGLATSDEVQQSLGHARQAESEQSLAQALVNNDFVTRRQIARLRQIIEAERSGQTIPGYKLLGKLGAGAMATVFKGKQLSLDRDVAIKILPRKFGSNPQFVERFYAEGR